MRPELEGASWERLRDLSYVTPARDRSRYQSSLLVYAHREDSPWHEPALRLMTALAEASATWAIPWPSIHEFLSIVSHPRIYAPPTPLASAFEQVDAWLESPSLVMIGEAEGYWLE